MSTSNDQQTDSPTRPELETENGPLQRLAQELSPLQIRSSARNRQEKSPPIDPVLLDDEITKSTDAPLVWDDGMLTPMADLSGTEEELRELEPLSRTSSSHGRYLEKQAEVVEAKKSVTKKGSKTLQLPFLKNLSEVDDAPLSPLGSHVRIQRGRSSSRNRPNSSQGQTDSRKAKPPYLGKLKVSFDIPGALINFNNQKHPYYPFHPMAEYSNQHVYGPESQASFNSDGAPQKQENALLHWYIALNQPSQFQCPLEASPEAWDTRGQKLIPIRDILDLSSGFNHGAKRDMMAELYLVMYYRHLRMQERYGVNTTHVLKRLGVGLKAKEFSPLVLICTFCGQYTDIEWEHIELYDSKALRREYMSKLYSDSKSPSPIRIGMLSVLTCNHPDCTNSSMGEPLPRQGYGRSKDDEDLYCQQFAMGMSRGRHKAEMINIVRYPVGPNASYTEGDNEKSKWEKLDLDENTIRYLRMETYFNTLLKEYWHRCRVCGDKIKSYPAWDINRIQMTEYAQKGKICAKGGCTFSKAMEKSLKSLGTEYGAQWVRMIKRFRAMRRGRRPSIDSTPTKKPVRLFNFSSSPLHADSDDSNYGQVNYEDMMDLDLEEDDFLDDTDTDEDFLGDTDDDGLEGLEVISDDDCADTKYTAKRINIRVRGPIVEDYDDDNDDNDGNMDLDAPEPIKQGLEK